MKTVRSEKPLSPEQLLQLFLHGDFKESQCQDARQRIKKEKEILFELIEEYREEIMVKNEAMRELERSMEVRAKLRVQLEALMNQRRAFDRETANQMLRLKQTPVEIRMSAGQVEELEHLRQMNCKMGVRLDEVTDYSSKLSRRIELMEIQNNIPRKQNCGCGNTRLVMDNSYQDLDWREKIERIKAEQTILSNQSRAGMIRNKVKSQLAFQTRRGPLFR